MIVTTWNHADDVLAAHAELDIRAGGAPRAHLIVFEGAAATLAALGADDRDVDGTRAMLELTELVAAVGAERFVLGVDLRDETPGDADAPLTVAALTAPRIHLRIRVWRGRWGPRARLRAVTYGRADDGAPIWGRARRASLWRRTALRERLTDVAQKIGRPYVNVARQAATLGLSFQPNRKTSDERKPT
jgi:hypothetical protein